MQKKPKSEFVLEFCVELSRLSYTVVSEKPERLYRLLPLPREMLLTLFNASSAPIGANVAVYVQLHDMDYPYACQTVALSTLLSVITLPLMLLAADWVL